MVREFGYKGETWRVTAHGTHGHEEVFIVHMEKDGTEGFENSMDRMHDPNDRNAPLQDIIILLCDQLIEDRGMTVSDPSEPFAWREGDIQFDVHDGIQDFRS
jgi:hypothetical protein